MERANDNIFPWRAVILGGLTLIAFGFAFYFYNNLQPKLGLMLLGVSFAIPMCWVVLAAREAEYNDSPLRNFVPRITVWLIIGSMILGAMHWNVDRHVTEIEAAFAIFYLAAAIVALRILASRPKRPQLTALSGGNLERRQRRRSR
jgi:hypothetical protein